MHLGLLISLDIFPWVNRLVLIQSETDLSSMLPLASIQPEPEGREEASLVYYPQTESGPISPIGAILKRRLQILDLLISACI